MLPMDFSNKKKQTKKKTISLTDSETEAIEFSKFIVLELLKEACLAKVSPFLIEKKSSPVE